jgi:hypothetical protein
MFFFIAMLLRKDTQMKYENEMALVKIAPYMFRYRGWDNKQESLMGFGFECGDGWFKLLENLITKISSIDDYQKIKVIQVKEKFGTLRFYYDGGYEIHDQVDDLINEAEEESAVTCEACGKPGTTNTDGWISCLCDECRQNRTNAQ